MKMAPERNPSIAVAFIYKVYYHLVMWLNRIWCRTGLTRSNLLHSYKVGVVLLWIGLNIKITRVYYKPCYYQ